MTLRFAAVAVLVSLAGCTWEGRPDGGSPQHADRHPDPLTRIYDRTDAVEPLAGTGVEPLDATAAPDAMPTAPGAPAPAGPADAAAIGAGSATGDGSATGRGAAMPGTQGSPVR